MKDAGEMAKDAGSAAASAAKKVASATVNDASSALPNAKAGECLGLVGGSGAGKSVILKSLIGLIKPDSYYFMAGETLNEDQPVFDYTHFFEEESKYTTHHICGYADFCCKADLRRVPTTHQNCSHEI